MTQTSDDKPIKQCPKCHDWFTLDQIYHDPDIVPIGLCFLKDDPSLNAYFFNHESKDCQTTFAVQVELLADLVEEQIPELKITGTPACEGHCSHIDDQEPCGQDCHYAPFRLLLGQMRAAKAVSQLKNLTT